MPLPLLEEIEICRTHTSTTTHDHTANPEELSQVSKGIRLGALGWRGVYLECHRGVHYSPLINAELHSGRRKQSGAQQAHTTPAVALAFQMLAEGTLSETALLASLGVGKDTYTVTEEIAMQALQAKRNKQISEETLLRLLNG